MLFAAGFGTRMAPLTDSRPKPLIKVAGRALLDHALAQASGVTRRVINTHYFPEQIERHIAGQDIVTVHEPDLLETGGGLRNALPALGHGPVFTLNTDAVWTGPSACDQLRAAWDPAHMDALLLLVPKNRALGHVGQGDFTKDSAGRLTRGAGDIYTGAQIIRPDLLHDIPAQKFSLNLLWERLLERGRLFGILHAGHWCDVGRPQSIALAEQMLKDHSNV